MLLSPFACLLLHAHRGYPKGATRAEREAAEAERKKAAYAARHAAGLTDEYKKDMARLAEAKARREELEAKKKEAAEEEARVTAAMAKASLKVRARPQVRARLNVGLPGLVVVVGGG